MVLILKKGATKDDIDDIYKKLGMRRKGGSGVDTLKYCGVLKLKQDPLIIQKAMRKEW